jgi:hypothetical protein
MRSASRTATGPVPLCGYRVALVALLALTGLADSAGAGDIYVICNPGVSLQASDVKDVFLGDKAFAGPVKLAPADNAAAQAAFLEKVLKLDAGKYSSVWTKKSFRDGVNPPPVKGTDAEVAAYVRQTAGACGYVGTNPADGVTVVARF